MFCQPIWLNACTSLLIWTPLKTRTCVITHVWSTNMMKFIPRVLRCGFIRNFRRCIHLTHEPAPTYVQACNKELAFFLSFFLSLSLSLSRSQSTSPAPGNPPGIPPGNPPGIPPFPRGIPPIPPIPNNELKWINWNARLGVRRSNWRSNSSI